MSYVASSTGYNSFTLTTPEIDHHFRREPFAKQLWQHCLIQPNGWIFRQSELKEYFGVGDRKWYAATKFLRESGLMEVEIIKDNAGRFFSKKMIFKTWDQLQHENKQKNNQQNDVVVTKIVSPSEKPNDSNTEPYSTLSILPKTSAYSTSKGVVRGNRGDCENRQEIAVNDFDRQKMRDDFLSRFGGRHTFQTFSDKKDQKKSLARVIYKKNYQLDNLNDAGAGVFFTVNECDGKGRSADNVVRVRAVFVDLDGAPIEPVLPYNPHVVVESSPGKFHAYWFVHDFPLEAFRQTQDNLAELFNGDKAVKDLSRVMRLPGYKHQKGSPFFTRVIMQSYHPSLDFREVVELFPTKPKKKFSGKNFQHHDTSESDWRGDWGTGKGERNHGLASFCGWMVARQYSYGRYEADGHKWGRSCNPPMSDREISSVLRSVWRYAA